MTHGVHMPRVPPLIWDADSAAQGRNKADRMNGTTARQHSTGTVRWRSPAATNKATTLWLITPGARVLPTDQGGCELTFCCGEVVHPGFERLYRTSDAAARIAEGRALGP